MKKIYLLLLCNTLSFLISAQAGEWVWMHGNNTVNSLGTFGTQGIPSATNEPPAVYEGCEWTDMNGNFWLYGGQRQVGLFYADLWKYDPLANEWTWINGPGTINAGANYGTQGVSSLTNSPGARGWAPASWVDKNNNLWMYGGVDGSASDLNDVWMYNIAANEWTWMKGSNLAGSGGSSGTKGIPNASNEPAARHETPTAWTDKNGSLWLFGGFTVNGQLDDLWKYDIASNIWTWMNGTTSSSVNAIYGTLGVADSANTPGARNVYSRWVDKAGNLWLFGGISYASGRLNDLWEYTISSNEWAWMNGPNYADGSANYGTLCTELATNIPSSRFENRSCWTDQCGNFWMFGGADNTGSYSTYNDLWKYSTTSGNWSWVSGSQALNSAGSYGTKGMAAPSNLPPSRFGSLSWMDKTGSLWIFGGQQGGAGSMFNDLWNYVIDSACAGCSVALPVASFQSSDSVFCAGSCISFTNLSSGATSYQWTFPGAIPSSSSDQNPQSVCYLNDGIYNVTLVASNSGGGDTLTLGNYIIVHPVPSTPAITQVNDTILYCHTDSIYSAYQWYADTVPIPGATDTVLVISGGGNYNVKVTNSSGCNIAVGINIILGLHSYPENNIWSLSPNPVKDKFTIYDLKFTNVRIEIYDVLGRVCSQPEIVNRQSEIEVDVSSLSPGLYFLQLQTEGGSVVRKFVKE